MCGQNAQFFVVTTDSAYTQCT